VIEILHSEQVIRWLENRYSNRQIDLKLEQKNRHLVISRSIILTGVWASKIEQIWIHIDAEFAGWKKTLRIAVDADRRRSTSSNAHRFSHCLISTASMLVLYVVISRTRQLHVGTVSRTDISSCGRQCALSGTSASSAFTPGALASIIAQVLLDYCSSLRTHSAFACALLCLSPTSSAFKGNSTIQISKWSCEVMKILIVFVQATDWWSNMDILGLESANSPGGLVTAFQYDQPLDSTTGWPTQQ
jgi:hypothetical protein